MIYADNAATTSLHVEALQAMKPYLTSEYGNPSSLHGAGVRAGRAVMMAREQIAAQLHCRSREICFTAGASEANNQAIFSAAIHAKQQGKHHIVVAAFEHPSVLQPLEFLQSMGFLITWLNPNSDGLISAQQVAQAIQPDTILVSVMMVNNEVGTIQPIREIAAICKQKGVLFHTDAVQAAGHLPIDAEEIGADFLSISAHKFHGPKGVGALICRGKAEPLIRGGGQERGLRAGTENVAGIVGMAVALSNSCQGMEQERTHLVKLNQRLLQGLQGIPASHILGDADHRMPGIVTVCFENVDRQTLLILLDQAGICVSAGSACSGGAIEPSHVLKSMAVPKEWANGAIRISLGVENTAQEVDEIVAVLAKMIAELRAKQGV